MIKNLSDLYLDFLPLNIPQDIRASFFQVKLKKNSLTKLNNIETLQRGLIYSNSLNDYLNQNLESKYVYEKIILIPLALVGINGDNETNIRFSNQIEFIVSDENKNDLSIDNLDKPIQLIIENDKNLTKSDYKYMNLSNFTNQELLMKFEVNKNVSIHFQIKPLNQSLGIGYLAKLKYGTYISNDDYDLWKLFCKNGMLKVLY